MTAAISRLAGLIERNSAPVSTTSDVAKASPLAVVGGTETKKRGKKAVEEVKPDLGQPTVAAAPAAPTTPPPETSSKPAAEVQGTVSSEQTGAVSGVEVERELARAKLVAVQQKFGRDTAISVLTGIAGVQTVGKVKEGDLKKVIVKCNELLSPTSVPAPAAAAEVDPLD